MVQRIRDSFVPEKLNILRWIKGFANIGDALTKLNPNSFKLFGKVFSTGSLCLPRHDSYKLGSEDWK